jgi:hypothetical protein
MHNDLYVMYRTTKVFFLQDGYACKIFEGKVAVDADGAPNAYGPASGSDDPDGCGLDSLTAACYPPGADDPLGQENWRDILVPDPKNPGVPYLKPDGFYISMTTLCDESKPDIAPGKFIDASAVSYIVMPQFFVDHLGMKLGDLCVLVHDKIKKPVVAIVGDYCPFTEELGEMSIKTALNLGAGEASPREGTTFPRGMISCRLFKNSAPKAIWPLTDENLQAMLPELAKKHGFDPVDPTTYMNGMVKLDTE